MKRRTLSDIGEDRLVARLTRALPRDPSVLVGPGDDCAVLGAPKAERWQLLKTDAVIERIHFLPEEDFRRVGWKALCRAISDVAAMGGIPDYALITLAAPRELELVAVQNLYAGLKKAARRFGVSIVGGETSRSPGPIFINIALSGWVERKRCVLRSGGRPGDALFVTGLLGGSRAGKHLDFIPRLAEARWLTEHFKIHAMMDLSDGLGADLPRLAHASSCGFSLSEIPCSPNCSRAQALSDGEDFELLFALPAHSVKRLQTIWPLAFPKLALTQIGQLSKPSKRSALHGFDHFARSC